MDEVGELRDIINATNIVEELILADLLAIVSLEHHQHKSSDPKIALSEVLTNYLPEVKVATRLFAATKLFHTEKRNVLLPKIDINNLDSGLVLGLLLKVESILGIARTKGICGNTSHGNVCCDDCVMSCDHSSTVCKKCISNGNKPTKKCYHKCKKCDNTKEQCVKDAEICCKVCQLCITCNKKLMDAKEKQLLGTGVTATSTCVEPCRFYLFLYCLHVLLNLRNLFAHATEKELKQFLDGTPRLKNFEMCKDKQELLVYVKWVFSIVLEYIKDAKNFKNPLTNEKCKHHEDNLKCILSCGKSLQKFILDNYKKMKSMHDTLIGIINSRLGESILEFEKDTEVLTDKKVKRWRRINGGVVLKLDITDTDEVEKVRCCTTDNVNNSFVIQHESRVQNTEEKYYDIQRIDDTLMLLKIENLENGNYKIDVTTQSAVQSFEVEVDSKLDNLQSKIGDLGIEFPSSDVKEFWEETLDIINNCERNKDCKVVWSEGASTTRYTFEDFQRIGINYLQRNFKEEEIGTCFKLAHLIENGTVRDVALCLEKLLTRKCIVSGKKFVILVSPDLDYHLSMINNKISSSREMLRSFKPCLLVFVEERLLIVIVRIALNALITEDILDDCQHDILNFIKINGCEFEKEKINIVGVIACPFIQKDQLKDLLPYRFATSQEFLYDKFFLCKDHFQNENANMDKWWEIMINKFERNVNTNEESLFSSLIGQHMTSMASIQEDLPTLTDCTHQQILTLFLNPSQITAIESRDEKKLITGPFGSGKTLVGQRILKNLAIEIAKSEDPGMLCYISCDPYSIVDAHVKQSMEDVHDENLTFLCGSMHNLFKDHVDESMQEASLDVLFIMLSNKYKNIKFVIDEINGAYMREKVAKNINQNLSVAEKPSIVFIQQSMKKERTFNENGEAHLLETDHFSLINGLVHHPLQRVMRSTIENQKLVNCTQRIIQRHTLKVPIPESQSIDSPQSVSSFEPPDVSIPVKRTSHSIPAESTSSKGLQNQKFLDEEIGFHDFDVSLRWMADSQSSTSSNRIINTDIRFFSGEEGHNISYCKPELIYLPESIPIELDSVKYLCPVFDVHCLEKNPVLIVHSIKMAEMFYHILKSLCREARLYIPYLQQKIPSLKEKEEVMHTLQKTSAVLITDNHSFIGMEAKNVVTIVDPKEKYLRHSIVEIISRCATHLQILVPFYKVSEEGTMSEILEDWKQEELIEVKNLVLDTQSHSIRPAVISPKTHEVIVYAKSRAIMEYDKHSLSIEDEEQFHIALDYDKMSNYIHMLISRIQKICIGENEKGVSSLKDIEWEAQGPSHFDSGATKSLGKRTFSSLKDIGFAAPRPPHFYRSKKPIKHDLRTSHDVSTPVAESGSSTSVRIFRHIEVDGIRFSFHDIWGLLEAKDFSSFERIVIKDSNITCLRGRNNSTFLIYAIRNNRNDIFNFLIKTFREQVDVMAVGVNGDTAFHEAAWHGNIRAMETLISIDTQGVNSRTSDGETPLHKAAVRNHMKMVKLLLDNGADPYIVDNMGSTAHDLARNGEIRNLLPTFK